MSASAIKTAGIATEKLACNGPTPPLQNGDRLTRDEFERRYDAMPNLRKAELIDGVAYVPSPAGFELHGEPDVSLGGVLFLYRSMTPGVRAAGNASVRLDLGSMPQPDSLMFIAPECGGQAKVDADDYLSGGPELVAEVAASSVSYDLHDKLRVFERNSVREYVVWRVLDRTIDWFVLRDGRYQRLTPGNDGVFRSIVFAGLWLDPTALVSGDYAKVIAVVQQGLATAEHAQFVSRLQQARQASAKA
jgi:Putative restriction endonuclease